MRSGADITATVRRGRRAARPLVVVHLQPAGSPDEPTLVGFVVGRSVGDAVTRHRVTRRLRHQVCALLVDRPQWRTGLRVVVRALPPASRAGSAELHADLLAALTRLVPAGTAGRPALVGAR
jgi:ribonuclease P protein component